jgi:hypothetical protein
LASDMASRNANEIMEIATTPKSSDVNNHAIMTVLRSPIVFKL